MGRVRRDHEPTKLSRGQPWARVITGVSRFGKSAIAPELVPELTPTVPVRAVALLISDSSTQRMFASIAATLNLEAVVVNDTERAGLAEFGRFELMIADLGIARQLRPLLNELQSTGEQVRPALVAIGASASLTTEVEDGAFDAVLSPTATPADLTARLSVILYSHRALARRYQSALEELHLNRNIFRSVTNGISVANAQLPDMPLLYVNPAFELMTGYSFEEVEGKNCRFLQADDRDQPGLTLIREALRQRRQTVAIIRNHRKDGSSFWNELTLSPIRNRDGELTHFVGIQMDVTERVELESALRQSEKLAAVGRLASSISHEINNPLEAVMNLLYLAEQTAPQTDDAAEMRGYLRQADQELRRVKLITAQSLRFYKQSTGPEAVLCSDLLQSVLDLYQSRLSNYNVEAALRERATQHIVGLASELRQVLSNLVGNAIDAMKAGGGRLLLRTRQATWWRSEKTGVLLTIADTGTGIPRETLSEIYKAFFTTKGVAGTGLGLWISSEIVARHRGHLKVRSSTEPGRSYTIFELFLPFQGTAGTEGSSKDSSLRITVEPSGMRVGALEGRMRE